MKKINLATRTFKSRLLFIEDIFSHKFEPEDIMANCIQYKLGKSYDLYLDELRWNLFNLDEKDDPLQILKRMR